MAERRLGQAFETLGKYYFQRQREKNINAPITNTPMVIIIHHSFIKLSIS
jgi:hypothetical protein